MAALWTSQLVCINEQQTSKIAYAVGIAALAQLNVGQVTIYLDEKTEADARAAARAEGMSLSKWITERVQRSARTEWPVAVRDLAGAWPDLPNAEELRQNKAKDVARKRLCENRNRR